MTLTYSDPRPETYTVLVTGAPPAALHQCMVEEYDRLWQGPNHGPGDGHRPEWALPLVSVRESDEGPAGLLVEVLAPDPGTASRRARRCVEAAAKQLEPSSLIV